MWLGTSWCHPNSVLLQTFHINVVLSMNYSLFNCITKSCRKDVSVLAPWRYHRLSFNIDSAQRYFAWKSTLAILAKFPAKFAQLPKMLPFFFLYKTLHFCKCILHSKLETVGIGMAPTTWKGIDLGYQNKGHCLWVLIVFFFFRILPMLVFFVWLVSSLCLFSCSTLSW